MRRNDMTKEEVFNEQYEIVSDEDLETFGPLQDGSGENQTYDYTFKKAVGAVYNKIYGLYGELS